MSHNEEDVRALLVQTSLRMVDARHSADWIAVAAVLASEVRRLQSLWELVAFIEDELIEDRHPQAVLDEVVQRLRQADV